MGSRGNGRQVLVAALTFFLAVVGAMGQVTLPGPRTAAAPANLPQTPLSPGLPGLEGRPLPINLATAFKLADAQALDIVLATQRMQAAAAQHEGSKVLWLPTMMLGTDYFRHDGQLQDITGNVFGTSKSQFMVGGAPYTVFSFSDAIFAPLAAKQVVRARAAGVRAAANDTMFLVAKAYFTVQQARGELAGALDTVRKTQEFLGRLEKLETLGGLAAKLEVRRGRAELANRRQAVFLASERWRAASAELIRLLHLDPTLVVQPLEAPPLPMTLLGLSKPVEELVPIALTKRPELAAQQALVQATLAQLRQERMRPLVPSLFIRGASTPVAGTLGAGLFGGGLNSSMGNFSFRQDWDVQLLWQVQNLGFGNPALVKQRDAEKRAALTEALRLQDQIAAEVVRAYAMAQTAARRAQEAEKELREAQETLSEDIQAVTQTKRVGKGAGEAILLLVRPQEVVAAIDMVSRAYGDFYSAIADVNRSQFQLYRALGRPAQLRLDNPADPPAAPDMPAALLLKP